MKQLRIPSFLGKMIPVLGAAIALSCGGGSSDEPKPEPVPDPIGAVLLQPANKEVCFDGKVISATFSEVTFSWDPSEFTDKYELVVTDLNNQSVKTYPASATSTTVSLERGIPYAWKVISRANNTNATGTSELWQFYLAGEGITTYAPFPATLESPVSGSRINAPSVNVEWSGNDPDSAQLNYHLYLDTTDGKTTMVADTGTSNSYQVNDLSSGTTYYWSVITLDEQGNSSRSPVFEFITE